MAALIGWAGKQTHKLDTEITINTPPERVWQVISETAAYPEWNPVIVRLEGRLQAGQSIEFENRSGNRTMIFRPIILKADAGRELRWLGHLLVRGLFDGEHYFVLTPSADGKTHLRHGEHFSGILIPFTRHWLNSDNNDGFTRINSALKARAEAGG